LTSKPATLATHCLFRLRPLHVC